MRNKYLKNKIQLKKLFPIFILLCVFLSWSIIFLSVAQAEESEKEMQNAIKGLPTPTAPHAVPPEMESPKEIIPYEFETGIPLVPGAEKGKQLEAMTLPEFVKKLIKAAFLISGILAFAVILWGGYEYLTSAGNTQKQAAALQRIAGAVIGLILLFAFWIILNTINPDILKTTEISSPFNNGGGDSGHTIPTDVQQLSELLLQRNNIQWYGGAEADLRDMKNGTPINVYENDPNGDNPEYNCLDKVEEAGGFATSLDSRILKVVTAITDPSIDIGSCGSTYNVGPFISGHNYCNNPQSKHAKGKAVDITLLGSDSKQCTLELLKKLCNSSNGSCTENQQEVYACSPTIAGVKVDIWDGTCTGEPHLHIQVP